MQWWSIAGARATIGEPMPGTRQLFVLRHGKSSWDDQGLDDHDRPLAPRGRRAVGVLADHLRATGIQPTLVLCSSSRRTRETLEGIDPGGEHQIEPELYSANTQDVLERLRRVSPDLESVMVIGHNPAMQGLILRLAASGLVKRSRSLRSEVENKFPTAALATLTFECHWSALSPGCAQLVAFVRPKALSKT
jgi:phosphohistidine phosphatase